MGWSCPHTMLVVANQIMLMLHDVWQEKYSFNMLDWMLTILVKQIQMITELGHHFIQLIKNYPKPKNVKQLQAFLGFSIFSFSHDSNVLFQNYPILQAKPLYSLLSKHSTQIRNKQHNYAFEKLKEAFISPPILGFPKFEDPNCIFILSTDASEYAMGAILSQTDGKKTYSMPL